MYDPMFAKRFKRGGIQFRYFALLLSCIIALTISSTFNSSVDDAVRMQLSINAVPGKDLRPPPGNDGEPFCRVLKTRADFCEFEGDVRVDSNSSTIFVVDPTTTTSSWIIQPHPRKGIASVKNWTVRHGGGSGGAIPDCTKNHSIPAILFSMGGHNGNYYHGFSDLLLPLFTTSFQFKKEVQFLASECRPNWWLDKYRLLLRRLSRYVILDTDHVRHVHCYGRLTAGLRFHGELKADPASGVTMSQFRQLLRQTYSLKRAAAVRAGGGGPKPRLLIVSRTWTRIITNEAEVSTTASKLGYEVVSAEGNAASNLTAVAQLVNSCDVMVGVHGAGLTNMLFLPENAVVIQIVPLGAMHGLARRYYGDPAEEMNIRPILYKIRLPESSLSKQYPADHPVIKDPLSIHRQGFSKIKEVYMNNQNVTIDVNRFRATLATALELLSH